MKRKFNWSASTQEAELVLQGEYTDDKLSEIQRLLLNNMKKVTDNEKSSSFITTEDFDSRMRKWRESTSTSPSGCHLGHYKVLVATLDRSLQENEFNKLKDLQSDIKKAILGSLITAYRTITRSTDGSQLSTV